MNVHSSSWLMSQPLIDASNADRRSQILEAALVCFAKRGFHQTSMHDISAEAGISVGLIYRYFENKEAVISAMADRHKNEINEVFVRARQAPNLLEALEILFTAHCCEDEPRVVSAFVVDLYAYRRRRAGIPYRRSNWTHQISPSSQNDGQPDDHARDDGIKRRRERRRLGAETYGRGQREPCSRRSRFG